MRRWSSAQYFRPQKDCSVRLPFSHKGQDSVEPLKVAWNANTAPYLSQRPLFLVLGEVRVLIFERYEEDKK